MELETSSNSSNSSNSCNSFDSRNFFKSNVEKIRFKNIHFITNESDRIKENNIRIEETRAEIESMNEFEKNQWFKTLEADVFLKEMREKDLETINRLLHDVFCAPHEKNDVPCCFYCNRYIQSKKSKPLETVKSQKDLHVLLGITKEEFKKYIVCFECLIVMGKKTHDEFESMISRVSEIKSNKKKLRPDVRRAKLTKNYRSVMDNVDFDMYWCKSTTFNEYIFEMDRPCKICNAPSLFMIEDDTKESNGRGTTVCQNCHDDFKGMPLKRTLDTLNCISNYKKSKKQDIASFFIRK